MHKNALYFAAVPFHFPLFICHHSIQAIFCQKFYQKMALLPVEHSKPIPRGTKVRFRWHNNNKDGTNKTAANRGKKHSHRSENQHNYGHISAKSIEEFSPSSSSNSDSDLSMSANNQLLDTQLVALRSRSSLDRSSIFSESNAKNGSSGQLISAGLLIISLSGFLLLILLGFCIFRMFQKDNEDEADIPNRSRELQVILVPKQRKPVNRRPSLVHPQAAEIPKPSMEQQNNNLIPISQQKPFPKRIYEIQAEEGYFSSAPSLRASFDIDETNNGHSKRLYTAG